MRTLIIALLFLVSPIPCRAETYEKIYEEGHWALYKLDGVQLSVDGSEMGPFDGVCLAEAVIPDSSLQISIMPPQLVDLRPELRGAAWIQVSKADWKFRNRRALAILYGGVFSLDFRNARYNGDSIQMNVSEFEALAIFLNLVAGRDNVDVLDQRKRLIAQFPTNGLSAVRDKLFDCAGLKWPPDRTER